MDALKDLGRSIAERKVVCVSSGGNFDFERLPEVKERAQRFAGRKKYLILRMPRRACYPLIFDSSGVINFALVIIVLFPLGVGWT